MSPFLNFQASRTLSSGSGAAGPGIDPARIASPSRIGFITPLLDLEVPSRRTIPRRPAGLLGKCAGRVGMVGGEGSPDRRRPAPPARILAGDSGEADR